MNFEEAAFIQVVVVMLMLGQIVTIALLICLILK